ncbi:lipopolysaccharide biosynthesis protein WzxC [mine drainage metagenome]|uniref:Lipopolysaccharide biosynthesis protein WzxC n=1 Tax=mine drainage metagenome TaxID=410659 RepID=A0A1J5S4E6_9ZZZZ
MSSQALRLGGNLILTRLLFPEAFGLMAIVQSVVFGLVMLSDIGIVTSIIHNKRGSEAVFVNTAWTMRVIQSVIIWVVLCMLAPLLAAFYAQPMLTSLLPVVGFGSVLGGLASTKLALINRSLALRKLVLIEVGSQAIGLLMMILWAWIDHTIWSLVWGGLIGGFVKTAASHFLLEGAHNKFAWDRDSVKELFVFGQWMLVSSILTFFAGEGNKLLLGAFLGVKVLSFFTLASGMSSMFWQIAQQVNTKVLFPAYAELVRERPERLREVAARSRLLLIVPGWLIALFFVLWGDHFMWLLYDQRYAESGNMLRMLAMGAMMWAVGGAYNGLLWAKGMVKLSTVILVAEVAIQWIGMMVGYHFLGERGVVLSAAAVAWLLYPAQAYIYAKLDLWEPKIDLPFIALSVLVVALNFTQIFNHV